MALSVLQLFSVSAFASALLLFPVRGLLRRAGVVDKPNERSSHTSPTVRGGGVAIVATTAVAMGVLVIRYSEDWSLFVSRHSGGAGESLFVERCSSMQMGVLLGAFLLLAVVSFVDDLRGLPARVRFGVQALCAVAAVSALITINGEPITITAILFAALAVVWITGYTNAFNFMDGINGIAGVQALVTGLGTALIAQRLSVDPRHPAVVLSYITAGAALGFLPHNFPRARVFMGDVSSATLGFLLAVLAFWIARLSSWWVLFWIGLLHANFVLDTGITLVRRARRGEKLSQAHREHFYQRLVRAGFSHTKVTLSQAAIQVLVVLALCITTTAGWGVKAAVACGVVGIWLAYFWFAERAFRSANLLATKRPGDAQKGSRGSG